jgi:hypothetical protein
MNGVHSICYLPVKTSERGWKLSSRNANRNGRDIELRQKVK